MLKILAAATVLGASSAALAATDDDLRQQIIGPWGQDAECADGNLTFHADGTFVIVMAGDDPEEGTWAISGGVLTGTGQPDSKVVIDGDTLALGDPDGGPRVERFVRCPV